MAASASSRAPAAPGDDPAAAPSRHERRTRRLAWRRRRRWRRAALLAVPLVATLLLAGVVAIVASPRVAGAVLAAVGVSAFGLGTSIVFTPTLVPGMRLTTWDLAWITVYANAATAFLYTFNFDLLEAVPRVGPLLHRARLAAAAGLRQHPWIRRLATFGTGFFVFLPLPGSGSLGGSILGRLVGLTPWRTWATVTAAGAAVAVLYAWSGDRLNRWLARHEVGLVLRIAGVLVGLLLVYGVLRLVQWLATATLETEEDRRAREEEGEPPAP